MLAASVPVLGHPTSTTMGIAQPDNPDFDLVPGVPSVYLLQSVSASTSPSSSEASGDTFFPNNRSQSPLHNSYPESSSVSFSKEEEEYKVLPDNSIKHRDVQEKSTGLENRVDIESEGPCVRPKYGSTIVGLPDKFMKEVEALEKDKRKKKKWRTVNAEDMGFRLTLFPREPVVCDEQKIDSELKTFHVMVEAELDCVNAQLKPFRHLLQLEGKGLSKDGKFTRRDTDRRVQKAHKQVKSKDITSVLNNPGRKTLYIHFRLYKRHPFLHCHNLEHPNLPSPPKREGVCLDVAKSVLKAQVRALRNGWGSSSGSSSTLGHPAQNLHHALDNRNAANELPTDMVSFLISLQQREMTPEDYEMLLRLDEGVGPKTVAEDVIEGFKTDMVDESTAGEVCSVCMEMYEVGQSRKFLPCEHAFHVHCIDMWLANSSQNCPLDGLPVGLS